MKSYLITTGLLLAGLVTHAQLYNDGAMTNPGGQVSDWSTQYISTATGTYSTAGSTGPVSSYGVFDHNGQSGTGTAAAMVNDGSYDASVFGRDNFNGPNGAAGQQEISGSSMPIFAELFIQNGAASAFDITNTNGIRVVTSATYSNGITTTVRNNTYAGSIKFAPGATYSGGNSDVQHVNGYVSKEGTDAFTFNVGDGSQLRTVQMTAPATATDIASVAWFTGDPSTITDPSDASTHSTAAMGSPIQWVSTAGFWDWIPQSGTFTNGITVSIPDVSGSGVNAADLRLVGWNGTQWVALGAAGAAGNTAGNSLAGTMQPGITAIGVGSISNPLPVLFSRFDVAKDGCKAIVSWSTAMEQNNDYFAVERSIDGRIFNKIATVDAVGNSSETQHYSYIDEHPQSGKNYYRVTQVDLDGKRSSTAVKSADFDCGKAEIKVYPTVTRDQLFVELPAGYEGAELSIYTTLGQQLHLPNTGKVAQSGVHSIYFSGLAGGHYVLRVTKGSEAHTFKVIYQP